MKEAVSSFQSPMAFPVDPKGVHAGRQGGGGGRGGSTLDGKGEGEGEGGSPHPAGHHVLPSLPWTYTRSRWSCQDSMHRWACLLLYK